MRLFSLDKYKAPNLLQVKVIRLLGELLEHDDDRNKKSLKIIIASSYYNFIPSFDTQFKGFKPLEVRRHLNSK